MKFCGRYQTEYKTDDIKTAFKTVVPPKKPYISRAFGFFYHPSHSALFSALCEKRKEKPKRKKAKITIRYTLFSSLISPRLIL